VSSQTTQWFDTLTKLNMNWTNMSADGGRFCRGCRQSVSGSS